MDLPDGSERRQARTVRIRALQQELRDLLDEEAAEVCKDLAPTKAECARMAKAGRRVEAVRLYRTMTGLSLRESRQMVESLISEVERIGDEYAMPVQEPLTHMQIVLLWRDRSDGPSTAEIVSFARVIERAHGIGA